MFYQELSINERATIQIGQLQGLSQRIIAGIKRYIWHRMQLAPRTMSKKPRLAMQNAT